MTHVIPHDLTEADVLAWLDWMIFYNGIDVLKANDLVSAEPQHDPEYRMAKRLLREWQAWRGKP